MERQIERDDRDDKRLHEQEDGPDDVRGATEGDEDELGENEEGDDDIDEAIGDDEE